MELHPRPGGELLESDFYDAIRECIERGCARLDTLGGIGLAGQAGGEGRSGRRAGANLSPYLTKVEHIDLDLAIISKRVLQELGLL